mgnify:CR=1 FL=1
MSDEEDGEMSAEAFYDKVIPSAWIGMLDLCLEAQGKMVEEAKAHMRHPSTQEEAEIIPFPTDNEGEQSE